MRSTHQKPVEYVLPIGTEEIPMNSLIGKRVRLSYQGEIHCIGCGRVTPKSYFQGYCFRCLTTLPQTDECILHPERCRAHEGISRDMSWAEKNCLQPHFVYLAVSSLVKVGVTRASQIPTRWIDQGASAAIRLAQTPNRHLAGLIEVELKRHFSERTSWQRMLKNQLADWVDLVEEKQRAWGYLPPELQDYVIEDDQITRIEYPVERYPKTLKSYNFDRTPLVEGVLTGIKGQYLIFADERKVLNIRKYGGYLVEMSA